MQPQFIQGYWRNRQEPVKKEDGGVLLAGALFGMSGLLFAIIFIRITLAVLAIIAITYYIKRWNHLRQVRQNSPKLVVNESGKRKVVYL